MKSVIFIAPPAGGKGTQSDLVCSKYKVPHISTGDLLRDASRNDDERGLYLKEQMNTGELIRDDIIYDLIKERLCQPDCSNGYVLDGFPRNLDQAKTYDEILNEINRTLGCVILLNVPKDLAMKRIAGRISCPKCGRVYNTMFDNMKPIKDNMCDDCHVALIKRADDNEKTYEVRYQTYVDKTEPLINFYKDKGVLYSIDSSFGKEKTFEEIEKIINN